MSDKDLILSAMAEIRRVRVKAADRLTGREILRLDTAAEKLHEALGILTARLVPPLREASRISGRAGVPRIGREQEARP